MHVRSIYTKTSFLRGVADQRIVVEYQVAYKAMSACKYEVKSFIFIDRLRVSCRFNCIVRVRTTQAELYIFGLHEIVQISSPLCSLDYVSTP